MKKVLILALSAMLAFAQTVSAKELSGWAEAGYEAANSSGLIPYSIAAGKATGRITRAEFCEIVMNMYKMMGGENAQEEENSFADTDNKAVLAAHALGIINGRSETEFCPDDLITRQEIAKILMSAINAADKEANVTAADMEKICAFDDFGDTDDWAAADVAKSIKYDILNGVSERKLMPKGYATREQAVTIISRAVTAFSEGSVYYQAPCITNLYSGMSVSDNLSVSWDKLSGASEYTVIVKDEYYYCMGTYTTAAASAYVDTKNMPYNKMYSITVGAKFNDHTTVYSEPVEIFFGTEQEVISLPSSIEDKYNRVFPDGVPFLNEQDAAYNMELVTVPVWKMRENGDKYSSSAQIMVNRNLAGEVVKIFNEIYSDAEKFPIKDVGGFSWRTTASGKSVSQHSYGTCIDINYDENYYCYAQTGEAITGSFWRPYEDPFSITENGSVVRAFAKYGWIWGGNAWTNLRDYMHFTYLGN